MKKLGHVIRGRTIDEHTRCVHYHSLLDIIAIKFKCCNEYYPCHECHKEGARHENEVWKKNEFDTRAILCGICDHEMTINEYLNCSNHCPDCNSPFNPNCDKHYHLYFEI